MRDTNDNIPTLNYTDAKSRKCSGNTEIMRLMYSRLYYMTQNELRKDRKYYTHTFLAMEFNCMKHRNKVYELVVTDRYKSHNFIMYIAYR